jgi:hypothetical protein
MARPNPKPTPAPVAQKAPKLTRFVRIVELLPKTGEAFRGYQPELLWLDEQGSVVKREMVDKPNLFEYAFAQAGDLIDPRNEDTRDE